MYCYYYYLISGINSRRFALEDAGLFRSNGPHLLGLELAMEKLPRVMRRARIWNPNISFPLCGREQVT